MHDMKRCWWYTQPLAVIADGDLAIVCNLKHTSTHPDGGSACASTVLAKLRYSKLDKAHTMMEAVVGCKLFCQSAAHISLSCMPAKQRCSVFTHVAYFSSNEGALSKTDNFHCAARSSDCNTLQAKVCSSAAGEPLPALLTEAGKAGPAEPPAGASPDEEAEEGELEPGERAAGWESGPEEDVGRHAGEPAGPEGK